MVQARLQIILSIDYLTKGDVTMNGRELTSILLEILQNNYLISPDKLKEESWDLPLTGSHFGLSGFELAALILEFEKEQV